MNDRAQRWLISTDELEKRLDDPDIRIFDCSTRLEPDPGNTYKVVACREEYRQAHIPGAAFIDIQKDLSRPHPTLRFTFPEADMFARNAGGLGIGDGTRVVLYSRYHPMWATRVWWLLRTYGFDNAAVLDGGIDKWEAEGRAVETGENAYPPATLTVQPRPGLIADREQVQAAIAGGDAVVLNALSREQHAGGGTNYGRPGRIAGSVNAPAREMIAKDRTFLPLDDLARMLDDAGADGSRRVVTYCGGGIAATTPAFVMALLGRDDVSLYDNSLSEWCTHPDLPMETDQQ